MDFSALPMEPLAYDGAAPEGLHATHVGVLAFYGFDLRVYQLSNGNRVIDADDVKAFFGAPA